MSKRAVVCGAGFGGLSAAALLAQKGWDVTLLEKNNSVGGRARAFGVKGFVFDMGPSWYLMPEVFERFFGKFGKTTSEYYHLSRLDPSYRVFFEPNETVDVQSSPESASRLFDYFEENGGQHLNQYLVDAAYKYNVAMDQFLYKDYTSVFQFLNKRMVNEGLKLNVFQKLHPFIQRYFHDIRAQQLLEYAMVFLGTDPKKAPALYSIMSHVDLTQGVFYPEGGLARVAAAIGELAEELGVKIKTNTEVTGVRCSKGKAEAVETNNGTYPADIVVMNADYHHAETELLEKRWQTYPKSYWNRRTVAPSMFLMYVGLKKKLKKAAHHTLFFKRNWDTHFDSIFRKPEWPDDPCFYLCCNSKTDPYSAPKNGENLFILVPISAGLNDDKEPREAYGEYVLTHIEHIFGESIRDGIDVKLTYSVSDFEREYNAFKGTALGLSHTLFQTAVFRPSRKSKKVKNLYYTGQYTHPGVGVPMTLISSEITADKIMKDFSSKE